MKRILLALAALTASPALAQSFPKPPDVAAYVAVSPLYKTNGTANVTIDPTVTAPPVTELTNIPIPSNAGRIVGGQSLGPGNPYCVIISDGGTCQEYKFRTTIDCSYILPDDPERNYGQPGLSHVHEFCGGGSVNAYSTYKSMRQHAIDSTAAGADANGTGYWRPATVVLNPYADGKNYALKDDYWTVYYVGQPGKKLAHYPVGLRFVTGFDMDSSSPAFGTGGQYAWLQTVLDNANTAQGYTRYTLTNPTTQRMQTQVQYECSGATPLDSNVIKNSDGSDPYGGTCASGATFFAKIDGANCWDGTNLWSTGSYKHLIPGVWDTTVSAFVCPYNYYQVPSLRLEVVTTQNGWTDRQRWDLSSDISYRAAHSLTTAQLPPGTTFHMDWDYGWDSVVFLQALKNCAGVDGVQGHECNSSVFSSTSNLVLDSSNGTGAGGRLPQVVTTSIAHVLQTDPGWMLIPPAWSGALTNMHMHH